jgi:hypothetical protein
MTDIEAVGHEGLQQRSMLEPNPVQVASNAVCTCGGEYCMGLQLMIKSCHNGYGTRKDKTLRILGAFCAAKIKKLSYELEFADAIDGRQ